MLANDSDPEGAALTPIVFNGPANGNVTVEADGTITYAPAADFSGTDSFTYKTTDGAAESGVATVTIAVQAVNDAPAVSADSYSLDEDATLQVADPGVLNNDGDGEGDGLSAMLVTGPAHGTLTLNADGSFIYTPDANYHGADGFTYIANDGLVDSTVGTVVLTVDPVNDTPVATDDSYSTGEDTPLVIAAPGVLGNDTDLDGDSLQVVLVTGPGQGTLALNANGSFTYTPASNANGSDSFSYKVSDASAESNVATVTIAVAAVNDAPIAVDETFTTNEDSALNVLAPGVLANDTDPEGSALSAVLASGPSHGALTPNADGSFSYTPAANFSGTDSFTYRASDGALLSGVATVTITVVAVDDAPAAVDDTFTAIEGTLLNVAAPGVLANDTDADGDALSAALVSTTSHGSLTFNANGSFSLHVGGRLQRSRQLHLQGERRRPVLRRRDGHDRGQRRSTTCRWRVPRATLPLEDTTLVVGAPGVLGNDTDADGDPLTAAPGEPRPQTRSADAQRQRELQLTPDGQLNGADKFTYRVNDGTADSNIVTVAINVTDVDRSLRWRLTTAIQRERGKLQLHVAAPGVLGNDAPTRTAIRLTATLVSGPSHGMVMLNTNGLLHLLARARLHRNRQLHLSGTMTIRWLRTSRRSRITVKQRQRSAHGTDRISTARTRTHRSRSRPPACWPMTRHRQRRADGHQASRTAPRHAGRCNADGGFTYTPDPNYNGPDTFTYRVRDSAGASDLEP